MSERFLADENFPAGIVGWLRGRGDDVTLAAEQYPGFSGERLLGLAIQEDRILLTCDRDFGELVFHQRRAGAPGIVLFRPGPRPPGVVLSMFRSFFGSNPALRGFFTVVSAGQFRQIRLHT